MGDEGKIGVLHYEVGVDNVRIPMIAIFQKGSISEFEVITVTQAHGFDARIVAMTKAQYDIVFAPIFENLRKENEEDCE